ncbi:regulatory solute carrier protein family 1 member 1 isoform X2 [Sorex fumeus]|nr:regulatory solute carrier protein family 1 member 1 isoform X2 [Sorex fumeus]
MSSLPTSGGSNHLAHPSGQSPEIGDPESFAHSDSASVCPAKPRDLDSIELKAFKALKATAEFQITSEKNEHLPLQGLSDHVSLAVSAAQDQSPALPLQDSSDDAIVTNIMEKSSAEKSTQGLDSHIHMRQEAVTTIRTQTTQRFSGEKVWCPEDQSLSEMNGLQQPSEPGCEQLEVVQQNVLHDQEHLYNTGNCELPGEQQQNEQKDVDLETTVKGNRLQQNVDLPGIEKNTRLLGCFDCSDSETVMDVEMIEQSVVVLLNSARSQNANVKNIGPSDTLDNPLMEVETSKCKPEILSNSISSQDLQVPESNVEMSGIDKEYDHCSLSLGHCGSCQPSVQSTEESCSSITAALKELHGLLVISNKPVSENTFEEVNCQSEIGEGQTTFKDLSERWTQNEHLRATQHEQYSQVSFHQTVSVSVKTEKSANTSTGVGVEGVENIDFRGPDDVLLSEEEGIPNSKESINESSSVTQASAKTSNQLHCTLGVEISPKLLVGEEDTLNQIPEQTKSLSSSFILVKDLGHGTQDSVTDRPETREDVCPEAAGPLLEFERPTSHLSSPSILPPLIFPATDIDRILRAGFTLQEALGALHQVGGNADLALLVLLAKNIVVPT